jgi:uncharacterized membrane protein YcaP (DUF421 family)
MFLPAVGIGELVLRVAIIYAAVFILLRMVGKKHVGELAPFDLVVLLLLSECVQNALIADDNSLTGGLVAAGALFGLNQIVGYVTWRAKPIERMLEGRPRFLVRHGRVLREELAREQITQSELLEALRRQGCFSIGKVRYAILENDGAISVLLRTKSEGG